MDQELFDEIKQHLDKSLPKYSDEEYVAFPKQDYDLIKIHKDNFSDIPKKESEKKITFVDGGQASLIEAPNFSLQLLRIAAVTFKGKKKTNIERKDTFCLVNSEKMDGDIFYRAKLFTGDEFLFNSLDPTIKQGKHRIKIDEINNVVRKYLELEIAAKAAINADVVVLDNSLKATITGEEEYYNTLYNAAKFNHTIIAGITKTTHMMTNNGNSVPALLQSINAGEWYYYPLAHSKINSHQAEISFIKLHDKAEHVFRFEIFKDQKEDMQEVISLLKNQSHDPVFFGYPYGLIQADTFARISNKEKEYVLTKFLARFGKDIKKLKKYMSAVDAHSILDSIG